MYRSRIAVISFVFSLTSSLFADLSQYHFITIDHATQNEISLQEPITDLPQTTHAAEKHLKTFLKKHEEKALSAKQLYTLALLYIQVNKLDKAVDSLQKARAKGPDLFQMNVQLGFVFLWQKDLDDAYIVFSIALKQIPCNQKTLLGLEKIALEWSKKEAKQKTAIEIYQKLYKCSPNNADYLFYLGRLLAWTHQLDEAEKFLEQCLKIAPQYTDAALQLAAVYVWQGKFDQAEDIYNRYPDNEDAKKALAKINELNNLVSEPITKLPQITDLTAINDQINSFLSYHPEDSLTAQQSYTLALLYIQANQLDKAKIYLQKALSQDPLLSQAKIQLGFVLLWQNHLPEAYSIFSQIFDEKPCDHNVLLGLEHIALAWKNSENMQKTSLEIYQKLHKCDPNNADYLFHLGSLLARDHQWDQAETILKECLKQAPQYIDADLQLASLYVWERRFNEAEEIYKRYQDNVQAQEGLARIATRTGNRALAEKYYLTILEKEPNNKDARLEFARLLASNFDFKEAKKHYEILTKDDPRNAILQRDLFAVKSHTDIALFLESNYVEGRENDPSLKKPVVKEYYFNTNLHLLLPLREQLQIDLKGLYFHQRENNIFGAGGTNFNARAAGAVATSRLLFCRHWEWDLFAREFKAWGVGSMRYPFVNTHRFEPGTTLSYRSDTQLLLLDAHVESFIIKNFAEGISELLKLSFLDMSYGYSPDIYLHPKIGTFVARVFYHDNLHNKRDAQSLYLNFGVPFIDKFFRLGYIFDHVTFAKLNPNYYSYKRQTRNTIEIVFHADFASKGYFELITDRTWQLSHDLFQPIGNFIFVAARQLLIENKFTVNLGYRVQDTLGIKLGGFYYLDTLPSQYYAINGSFLWQF